ncbi:TatD DNase [Mortierella polycephala]|uniref:TatD DNase n=1 Tax=Mortierella polycephala TaxID=41804 RepID=A0A9P6TWE3_9FUNG|nr:TatD DNase [Mortierella polycephala]
MEPVNNRDIGINLTDPMFRGHYHGKQVHADDFELVLQRATRAGVDRMFVTAGNLSDCEAALDLVKGHDGLFMTVGCHPTRCSEFESHPDGPEGYFSALKAMLESSEVKKKVVAIGECGLDYDRLHFCPKETQLKFFERQFDLAESTRLPMFLHNRNTGSDFGKLVSKHRSRFTNGVVHSFTGTLEEMKHYLDLDLFIGINGCSLKTEENLKVAASVPLEKLMLETDGPWCDIRPTHASFKHLAKMTPEQQALYSPPSKKKERFELGLTVKNRNEPCTMGQVLHVMADLHAMDPEALSEIVYQNTMRVFFPDEQASSNFTIQKVTPMKLAERMKKHDGSTALGARITTATPRKRKLSDKSGEDFAGYGVNADKGGEQDENRSTRNMQVQDSSNSDSWHKNIGGAHIKSTVADNAPSTKKQKGHQAPSKPPAKSMLLNYFSKASYTNNINIRNNVCLDTDARKPPLAPHNEVSAPDLASNGRVLVGSEMGNAQNVSQGKEKMKSKSLLEQDEQGIAKSCDSKEASREEEAQEFVRSERASTDLKSVDVGKEEPNLSKLSLQSAEQSTDSSEGDTPPTKVETRNGVRSGQSAPIAEALARATPTDTDTLDKNHGESRRSKLVTQKQPKLKRDDYDDVDTGISKPDSKAQPRTDRSMLEFFVRRPKIITDISTYSINGFNETEMISKESYSTPTEGHNSERPRSYSAQVCATNAAQAISGGSVEEQINGHIQRQIVDLTLEKVSEAETKERGVEDEANVERSPRLRRLVRARDMKPRRQEESSASKDDTGRGATTEVPSKAINEDRKRRTWSPSPPKSSPESGPETIQESEPEPEFEPELEGSRRLLMNYFGAITTSAAQKPTAIPVLSNGLKETKAVDTVQQPGEIRRPIPRTYSKAEKAKRIAPRKKERKKKTRNPFSDSEWSESDINGSSDDSLADFMLTEDRPDPGQMVLTSMLLPQESAPSVQGLTALAPLEKSKVALPGGIINRGNTCYLNSIMQTLRCIRECSESMWVFEDTVKRPEESSGFARFREEGFLYEAIIFLRALKTMEELGDTTAVHPDGVLAELKRGVSEFKSDGQQDAGEFLLFVISSFDDAHKLFFEEVEKRGLGLPKDAMASPYKDRRPPRHVFEIGIQKVYQCQTCAATSTVNDTTIDLGVQIDRENEALVHDLDWGITESMKTERMNGDNQKFCDNCNSNQDAIVYQHLTSLPSVIILRLQRYHFVPETGITTKLRNGVGCSEIMNFGKWMKDRQPQPDYELCAVIVHTGSNANSGHYYTYIKRDTDIKTMVTYTHNEPCVEERNYGWIRYNDNCVDAMSDEHMQGIFANESSIHTVEQPTPYVYIYRRLGN